VDVLVVGAGLSGIGAGYRLQTECPGLTYEIVEARDAIGGTWDLFRYPGVRSDSDMFTLCYPFRPWREPKSIADGGSILAYVRETATAFGIDARIRFRTRVLAADWSSEEAHWTVTLEETAEDGTATRSTLICRFLYACTGYYDYAQGYTPEFPGIENFAGEVVHPQFWPEELDYAGKRVVVIGSGATAITLVPALAETAGQVTMLQRSPTWIAAVPGRDRIADGLRGVLPSKVAHRVIRTKNILFSIGVYEFCRRRPKAARKVLTRLNARVIKDDALIREHFSPTYNPWDQRVCAAPDADFHRALKSGHVDVVTDHIETFVPEGIRLKSGRVLAADVVVTATGLKLLAIGGVAPSVDGEPVALAEQYVWRGAMVSALPNFAVCIGYSNASWTLRADITSRLVCKILNHMERNGLRAVVPEAEEGLGSRPLLDLTSGYIQRSLKDLPRQGDRSPWRVSQNYVVDVTTTLRADLTRSLRGIPASRAAKG
jgi:cation diffusion facilitator CzcD-associated flavoprotein CzcO